MDRYKIKSWDNSRVLATAPHSALADTLASIYCLNARECVRVVDSLEPSASWHRVPFWRGTDAGPKTTLLYYADESAEETARLRLIRDCHDTSDVII